MQNELKNIFILFLLVPLFFLSCDKDNTNTPTDETDKYQIPEQIDDGWETASLSDVGMEEEPIIDVVARIQNEEYDEVHSIVIIKDGKLVVEEYFPGHDFGYTGANYHGDWVDFDRDTRHNTHSATKSITSAVVGIGIDQSYINSADDKIFSYFFMYSHLRDSTNENITIKHLLTMTSGFEWNEWDVSISESEHDIVQFNTSRDPVGYLLRKPVIHEPGTVFYYNGGVVDLLGEIVRHAAHGNNIRNFSDQHLFQPLGISNYQWQTLYPSGITCCHGDIYITPRDLAKFGYLFLNNGVWQGNQIISEKWVNESTQAHLHLPTLGWADAYGYLWWHKNYSHNGQVFTSIKAMGWGGQEIILIKSLNLVVVFTGANYVTDPPCDEIVEQFILPAIL